MPSLLWYDVGYYGGQHVVIDFENSRIVVANSIHENWDFKKIIYEPIKKLDSDEYFHGLAIELKVGYNKPTEHQWYWIEMLRQKDYIAEVCYDLDTAIDVIETYMGGFIK